MKATKRPIEFWLEQILFWGSRMSDHCSGMTFEMFARDNKTIDAVSWCIGCVGEASGNILRIEPGFEGRNPDLELVAAYSARNRVVHAYYDLDLQQIWDTATISVPRLMSGAAAFLHYKG